MPAPKGRCPPTRYNQVPEHTEPSRELVLDAPVRVAVESCSCDNSVLCFSLLRSR